MSRLSRYSVGLSSDYRVGELFIDCKSRCPVCQNYSVGLSSDYRMGELFIDCKSRCPVCLAYSVGLSSDYRVGELFIDCKSRCPVCLAIQSVYRLTIGWESYLSTVRVGVPSVWLLSRSIV